MKLDLSNEDLIIIDKAIQELPYRIVEPLIKKINRQLSSQSADEDGTIGGEQH